MKIKVHRGNPRDNRDHRFSHSGTLIAFNIIMLAVIVLMAVFIYAR
jgi:hypothetical protein